MRSFLRTRRAALGELGLATAAMVSTNVVMVGIGALIPLIRRDLPLSTWEIGAAAATPSLSALLSLRFSAGAIDRWGAGVAVGVSQVFCAASSAVAALAPNVPVLFAGIMLAGIGFAIVSPASNVLSMGLISARHRGLAMSIKQTGVTAGGALAGLTLPGLALATSWRVAQAVPVTSALSVACWGFATHTRGARKPLVLNDRTISLRRSRLGLYGFAMSGIQLTIFGYTAVYLVDHAGFSPQRAGAGLAVALASGTAGRVVWGILSDRARDRLRILQLVAGGSAVVLAVLPFASHATIWPLLVVLGFCSVGWNGVFNAVVAESSGAVGVSRATSAILPFLFGGAILMPPLLGLVADQTSWSVFWWVGAAGALCAFATSRALQPKHAPV
jgi:MFS family permease